MNSFDINKIQLTISAPELTVNETLNEYILEQITKLGNLFDRITQCELMLRKESARMHLMEADIKIFVPGAMLYATGKNSDLRVALSEAFHDVHEQLHRHKEKVRDHHANGVEKLTESDLPVDEVDEDL